jgi:hypothetical protein
MLAICYRGPAVCCVHMAYWVRRACMHARHGAQGGRSEPTRGHTPGEWIAQCRSRALCSSMHLAQGHMMTVQTTRQTVTCPDADTQLTLHSFVHLTTCRPMAVGPRGCVHEKHCIARMALPFGYAREGVATHAPLIIGMDDP